MMSVRVGSRTHFHAVNMFSLVPPLLKLMVWGGVEMRDKKERNSIIGCRIKQAREDAGMTQERLAELIGLSAKNISAIERGTVGISVATLIRICRTLSVSSDYLLSETPAEDDINKIHVLTVRLEQLSPEEFNIVKDIVNVTVDALTTAGESKM